MKRIIVVILLSIFSAAVLAKTYYVDVGGNDANDGLSTTSPWQTISRVNAATLAAGDNVLFHCGQTWRETLVAPSSGVTGSPVTFGSYGSNCTVTNKPVISGADAMSSSSWSGLGNYIYSMPLQVYKAPVNKIINGVFDASVTNWYSSSATQVWQSACTPTGGGCMKLAAVNVGGTNSNTFSVESGKYYKLKFSVATASANPEIDVVVRKATAGAGDVGLNFNFATTDAAWHAKEYIFQATSTEKNANLVFATYNSQTIYLDDVSITNIPQDGSGNPVALESATVQQVFADGGYVRLAQYPNPNPSPTDPTDFTDTYLPIVSDSSTRCPDSGGTGTTSFDTSTVVPNDLSGAGIHIRINDYMINDRKVTSVASNAPNTMTVNLDTPTDFNLCKDWGFYFDNKLWMLDQPNEWFYDSSSSTPTLYVQMPDSGIPGSRVEAAYRDYGIDARGRSYLVIDGIDIEKAATGVDLTSSSNVTIQNSAIKNIGVNGIAANDSDSMIIQNCDIENTVRSGVYANAATNASMLNNIVNNAGRVGAPKDNLAAIVHRLGNGTITGNHVTNSGYDGIVGGKDSTVSNNVVDDACTVLNDCGAFYTSSYSSGGDTVNNPINTVYSDNIVRRVHGNPHGRPAGYVNVRGIYLDGGPVGSSSYVTVTHNTVIDSQGEGLSIKGHHNTITYNTTHGTQTTPLLILQVTGSTTIGTTHDNLVLGNQLFPGQAQNVLRERNDYAFMDAFTAPSLYQETSDTLVDQNDNDGNQAGNFAAFDTNRYSRLYTRLIARERNGNIPPNWTQYSLPDWQKVLAPSNTNNIFYQDTNATLFAPFSIARYQRTGALGSNLVTNSTFDNNSTSDWSASTSNGTLNVPTDCATGGCLGYTLNSGAGGVTSNALSGFSIMAGQYYLVHFDLHAQADKQMVEVGVVDNTHAIGFDVDIFANANWQSYAYVFQAAESTTTGHLTFILYNGGAGIELDNVRVQPIAAPGISFNDASHDSAILVNDTQQAKAIGCPDATVCGTTYAADDYVFVDDGTAVTSFPVTIPAMSSRVVVWTKSPFKDIDRDGIVDSQDACPATVPDTPVDENGCAFTQQRDLVPTALSVSISGGNLAIKDSVKNQGRAAAGPFVISYYLSTNTTYEATDTLICTRSVASLAAGASNPATGTTTTTCATPAVPNGAYHVLAVDDSGNTVVESNESNNTASTSTLSLGADLIPQSISVSKSGSTLTLNDAVKNQGTAPTGSFTIRFYLSKDTAYQSGTDYLICSRTVSSLGVGALNPASGTTKSTCTVPAAAPAGTYHVLVFDDATNTVIESSETNNTKATTGTITK